MKNATTNWNPRDLDALAVWRDFNKVRPLQDGYVAVTNLATFGKRRRFVVWLLEKLCWAVVFPDDAVIASANITGGALVFDDEKLGDVSI